MRTHLNPSVKDNRSCVAELLGGFGGSLKKVAGTKVLIKIEIYLGK